MQEYNSETNKRLLDNSILKDKIQTFERFNQRRNSIDVSENVINSLCDKLTERFEIKIKEEVPTINIESADEKSISVNIEIPKIKERRMSIDDCLNEMKMNEIDNMAKKNDMDRIAREEKEKHRARCHVNIHKWLDNALLAINRQGNPRMFSAEEIVCKDVIEANLLSNFRETVESKHEKILNKTTNMMKRKGLFNFFKK